MTVATGVAPTGGKQTKPILDTKTGKEYSSMYQAGKAIGKKLVPEYTGADRLIWFSMARKFPDRFQTKNAAGEWVALNDPSIPKITRVRKSETDDQKRARLLAELGEIDARRAANGTAAAPAAAKAGAKRAAAPVAAAEESEDEVEGAEEEEEVEEVAPAPAPRQKLAQGMKKS